jgi:hypothetical protein
MRKLATALLIGTLCLCLQPAVAADGQRRNADGTRTNSQRDKMGECNATAAQQELKGPDRQNFMKQCLSSKPAAGANVNRQQEKMKQCNADANTQKLDGDTRKAFMKQCLAAPASHPPH